MSDLRKRSVDDKSMANFMICRASSHGTLMFFTGDGCFFTSDEKVAEELVNKGRRVHVVDRSSFLPEKAEIHAMSLASNALSIGL